MHKFYKVKKGQVHSVRRYSDHEVQIIKKPKAKSFNQGFAITNSVVNKKILVDINWG